MERSVQPVAGPGWGSASLSGAAECGLVLLCFPPNYLSLRDDLPAQGFLAATFRSSHLPGLLLGLAAPGLPLLALPAAARLFRRLARRTINQDAVQIDSAHSFAKTAWHVYQIDWQPGSVTFTVDGQSVLATTISPRAPLALVLWIDNQYAALPPNGRLGYGSLEAPQPAWIEIAEISLSLP